ncbi:serine protease gd-like [Coccinella septempunctata]|uniref:serine protease gd-like n=1 Tax=Coccinella septempunctata TaxID=41139 RepID=UPI001D06AEC9|nr:serine protease gd-like [Coccinella septempunctata]
MCPCESLKKFSILCFFLFWTHLQNSVCGMKLGQLGHRQYYSPSFGPVVNSNRSPCPNIFEYRYDDNGVLFGFLQIPIPDANVLELRVEFVVANRIGKGQEGTITLPYTSKEQILRNIQSRVPLNYRVNFPSWQGLPPKITKIVFNGDVICFGEPYTLSTVPVLTTIHLLHKLNINVTPLVASPAFEQATFFNNDNVNKGFDGRNRIDKSVIDNPDNPLNFRPKGTVKSPNIVSPYSGNPFLNKLSSTTNKPLDQGNPFFISTLPTVEILDITPKGIITVSPKRQPNQDPSLSSRDSTSQFINEVCGLPIITNSLILHGTKVSRGAYPWLVAIFHTTDVGLSYKCTGVLISKRLVVTAAHCVRKDDRTLLSNKIVMVLGRTNLQQWEVSDGVMIGEAEDVHVHPNYTTQSSDADIAVLELRKDVVFSLTIRPICLWDGDDDLGLVVGKTGLVVGWGKDENGLKFSPEPKQIELPIVSQEQCLRSGYAYRDITSERTFCAGNRDGRGPCNGDSGGGFVMKKNGRWFLRGVVSMSLSDAHASCDLSNYVVFTDASKHKDWLLSFS